MKPDEARKIITVAIEGEIEAYSYYTSISGRVKDPLLKKLFREIAGEEKAHRVFLEEFLSRDIKDMHFDVGKKYFFDSSVPTPPLSPDMKPVEGLVIAIKKELEAMQMYTHLAELSSDHEQQHLFQQLAAMEKTHKERLENVYTAMAFPATW